MHQSHTVHKIQCFYLHQFQRYKALNIHLAFTYIHTRAHTHMHAQTCFQKTLFWTRGNLKTYKSGEKQTSRILTENNIYLDGSRVMEIKCILELKLLEFKTEIQTNMQLQMHERIQSMKVKIDEGESISLDGDITSHKPMICRRKT